MKPRVLFVSKPVVAPFNDGTKCLVRDIASNLSVVEPVVLGATGMGQAPLGPSGQPLWEAVPVYRSAGHYSPSLAENLRAAVWLAARSRADVWHFVFAPNPRSSAAGRVLRRLRRKPVVQTVASPPRDMSRPDRLLFGDVIVAQSRWTASQLAEGYASLGRAAPLIQVIPPPVPRIERRTAEEVSKARIALGLEPEDVLFVYPGDIEVSSGAERVAELVEPLSQLDPRVRVVFAYRQKTPRADEVAEGLSRRLDPTRVRFAKRVDDVLALIQGASAVLFPVDDLWGKVDLPIVLLETMSLGVPVLALDEGPLEDLEGAILLPADREAWLRAASGLLCGGGEELGARGQASVERNFRAEVVAARYEALYLELVGKSRARAPNGPPCPEGPP